MGSGCTSSNTSGSYFGKKLPDTGISYTGPAIPSLNICTGDTLAEVEAVILNSIVAFAKGRGIHISNIDLTACDLFISHVQGCNSCDELECLIQIIFEALCILYTDLEVVKTRLTDLLDGTYYTACLAGLPTNPTFKQIIQTLLTEFCALKTRVGVLETTVSNLTTTLPVTIGDFLKAHINTCQGTNTINKSGTGSAVQIVFKGFVPVGGMMPYYGSLANFNGDGSGKINTDMCGYQLCNGQNGSPNMSGLVPVGTTDMATPVISGRSLPYNNSGGVYDVLLSGSQCGVGSHTHTITDNGHSHKMAFGGDGASGNVSNYMKFDSAGIETTLDGEANVGSVSAKIRKNTTGITINTTSASATSTHENMMPYRTLYYIIRVS